MTPAPAFQHYAKDHLADMEIMLWPLEVEGAYFRLRSICWLEGSLPNDNVKLSILAKGASPEVLALVRKRFVEDPADASRLIDPALEREREKQREWREKSAAGGRKSAQTRRVRSSKGGSDLVDTKREPNGNIASAASSASAFSSSIANAPSTSSEDDDAGAQQAYIDRIEQLLLGRPCVSTAFGRADRKVAAKLFAGKVPVDDVEYGIRVTCVRWYCSAINGEPLQKIGSLKYFEGEVHNASRPEITASYREHVKRKLDEAERQWLAMGKAPNAAALPGLLQGAA